MKVTGPETPPSEKWDEEIARELIDCLVLVGITYIFPDGSLSEQHQLFGHVVAADPTDGIELRLAGRYAGKKYRLPPDTRALRRAPPGQYQLKSTSDVVSNPDYTCAWTIPGPQQ
jgi:hypothetical protein